ncbi:nicotinate phosphoribosyltransferase, partial [Staphylococcus aureus]
FTLLHDTEEEAFRAQLAAYGEKTTLLVDTYDIDNAVRTAIRLTEGRLGAVRIDSGDLSIVARQVRNLLDDLGAPNTRVIVT